MGHLGSAILFTGALAIAQPAVAQTPIPTPIPSDPLARWIAYPAPEEQQVKAIQAFYTTRTDLVMLEQAMQISGLPLNQLEITTVLPMTWPDGCLGIRCWDDVTCQGWLWDSGLTQETPIMPDRSDNGVWVFEDVPTRRWFDPPLTPGFTYDCILDKRVELEAGKVVEGMNRLASTTNARPS